MLTTPTWGQIQDGMIEKLRPLFIGPGAPAVEPAAGHQVAGSLKRYLRALDRYYGQFDSDEAFKQWGVSGRTPAMLVAFAGEKYVSSTVGGKVDKVKAFFTVLCAVDLVVQNATRGQQLEVMCKDARFLIGGSSLAIDNLAPLCYDEIVVLEKAAPVMCWGVKFWTIYRNDYTRDPGPDLLASTAGGITKIAPGVPPGPSRVAGAIINGAAGRRRYVYKLQAQFADGLLSNPVQVVVDNGPDQLAGGGPQIELTWEQADWSGGALVKTHVYRYYSEATGGGSATTGKIGELPAPGLTFDDDGAGGMGNPGPPDPRTVGIARTF